MLFRSEGGTDRVGYGPEPRILLLRVHALRVQPCRHGDEPDARGRWSITGVYDYMLEIHVPSLEFLHDLLTLLSKHGKITTHIVLPNSAKKTSISAPRETI